MFEQKCQIELKPNQETSRRIITDYCRPNFFIKRQVGFQLGGLLKPRRGYIVSDELEGLALQVNMDQFKI